MTRFEIREFFRKPSRTSATLTGIIMVLAISGLAQAITSDTFTYSAVKTGYYPIHPFDLSPDSDTSSENADVSPSGAIVGSGCFNTGVKLPQGATIVSITMWARSGVSTNPYLFLKRHTPATGAEVVLVDKQFPDDTNVRKSFSFTIPTSNTARVVNNSNSLYGFLTCVGTNTEFYGARITYTYRNAGD